MLPRRCRDVVVVVALRGDTRPLATDDDDDDDDDGELLDDDERGTLDDSTGKRSSARAPPGSAN